MTVSSDQPSTEPGSQHFPMDASLRDAVTGPLRHAGDVARLLQAGRQRWTDALLSEVRAHLFGCLNAIELAIALQMGDSWLARPVEALGPGYCRAAIERHPALLSPLLVEHLRLRAAAAIARRIALSPLRSNALADAAPSVAVPPALSDAVTAYRLATDPWFAPHPLDRPMRPDLAAEPYCDLVWTAAALLIDGLARRMGVDDGTARPIVARAAETIVARHDEQAGPFARAAWVAVLARDGDDADRLAGEAALRHDLLLLAALAGRRVAMTADLALSLLLDGDEDDRAALARLLNLDQGAYYTLLDALAPLQAETAALPLLLDRYRGLTPDVAADRLHRWRGPAALMDKLTRMASIPA